MTGRRYRAGDSIEDVCRACKLDRMHTVVVADSDGRPIRVSCGYCGSEHNYRGGPAASAAATASISPKPPTSAPVNKPGSYGGQARDSFPLVSERERTAPPMSPDSPDFELLLRRIIRGTLFCCSVPIFADLRAVRASKHYRPSEHLYYWTAEGFIAWMENYGFRLLEQSDHEQKAGRDSIGAYAFRRDK